jgi:hypothetical protein
MDAQTATDMRQGIRVVALLTASSATLRLVSIIGAWLKKAPSRRDAPCGVTSQGTSREVHRGSGIQGEGIFRLQTGHIKNIPRFLHQRCSNIYLSACNAFSNDMLGAAVHELIESTILFSAPRSRALALADRMLSH